ncbi:MAG TPA: pseudouridine synthase [Thermoanaerobaculia bacterium]|nr:pseudouridine synthase [Thermoanaerobaculia bacterium]
MHTLQILLEEGSLVAVDKPSGMLVHRGWGRDRVVAMTVVRDLLGRRVYPVHRLDRGTSGVLLFALDPGTARAVQERFQEGRVEKRYLALVRGVAPEAGLIDHPLPRAKDKRSERIPAVTEFRCVQVVGRYSLVEAVPHTGRLHQVRRHLKHLSLPLVGDVEYGKGEHNRLFRERHGLHRLALHAASLALPHPADDRPLRIEAPLPEDLRGPLVSAGFLLGD